VVHYLVDELGVPNYDEAITMDNVFPTRITRASHCQRPGHRVAGKRGQAPRFARAGTGTVALFVGAWACAVAWSSKVHAQYLDGGAIRGSDPTAELLCKAGTTCVKGLRCGPQILGGEILCGCADCTCSPGDSQVPPDFEGEFNDERCMPGPGCGSIADRSNIRMRA
jgi:hypothetical protein